MKHPSPEAYLDVRVELLARDGDCAAVAEILEAGPRARGGRTKLVRGPRDQGTLTIMAPTGEGFRFFGSHCLRGGHAHLSGGLYIQDFKTGSDEEASAAILRAHRLLLDCFQMEAVLAISLNDEDRLADELAPGFVASYREPLWNELAALGAKASPLFVSWNEGWVTLSRLHPRVASVGSAHEVQRAVDSVHVAMVQYLGQKT